MSGARYTHAWHEGQEPKPLSDVVESCMDGNDYGVGQIEAIADTARNCARLLGCIAEALVEKGIISLDDLHLPIEEKTDE